MMIKKSFFYTLLLVFALGLTACGGSSNSSNSNTGNNDNAGGGDNSGGGGGSGGGETPIGDTTGRTFTIAVGPNSTRDMVAAMIQLKPGDVMEFACGFFEMDQGLLIQATEDVLIKGCGIDKTVISFKNSQNVTGLEALNVRGITVEDLTILDSPGDAFKLKGVNWGTLRNVRALWSGGGEQITKDNYPDRLHVACTAPPFNEGDPAVDYIPNTSSGRYGIYPVESNNILVEGSESIGASDAGIYVGQTNNAIIRNSRAAYNVMGFEIENVMGGEYDSNIAECNTGAFLIYDLSNITQYGDTSVMHDNIARNNNTYNFAPGGIVGAVPRGTGFITLGYDNIEIYDNHFEDHSTAAIIYASYELLDGKGKTSDRKLDPYTEGIHIHDNVMIKSGYDLPQADIEAVLDGQIETVLPTLIGLKNIANGGTGAHIVWDGLVDELDSDCPYPSDANGSPVPQNAAGKPQHTNEHPNPDCHYNAYKFTAQAERIQPDWGSCFHSNDMSDDSQPYLNFHGTRGLEIVLALAEQDPSILTPEGLQGALTGLAEFTADTDMSVHDCQTRFGKLLPTLPLVTIPPFERSGTIDPSPSDEVIAQLCATSVAAGEINRAALTVNCPSLDQYNLFSDAEDPRSMPHDGGVPFVLNSKLFSDYATKYRVAFIPPGTSATYRAGDGNSPSAAISFPTGTVIAKTFAFSDEQSGTELPVETRLLIKRQNSSGQAIWDGIPYIWETDGNGKRVAKLAMGGGSAEVQWHYNDVNSGTLLSGSTANYAIPNANQCITCHSNDDAAAGSAPIGPKVRNLNRAYRAESSFASAQADEFPALNQLQYWIDQGLLVGAPTLEVNGSGVATNIARLPKWNVAGDSGESAGSPADIEDRVRAYLEVNCQHCHNDKGAASNTGYYLDHFRNVDAGYGICKRPTATGSGACGREHVLVPGSSDTSIMPCRVADVGSRQRMMPPIARSVAHAEAVALIDEWVNNVVTASYENGDACDSSGSGGGTPGLPDSPLPLPDLPLP